MKVKNLFLLFIPILLALSGVTISITAQENNDGPSAVYGRKAPDKAYRLLFNNGRLINRSWDSYAIAFFRSQLPTVEIFPIKTVSLSDNLIGFNISNTPIEQGSYQRDMRCLPVQGRQSTTSYRNSIKDAIILFELNQEITVYKTAGPDPFPPIPLPLPLPKASYFASIANPFSFIMGKLFVFKTADEDEKEVYFRNWYDSIYDNIHPRDKVKIHNFLSRFFKSRHCY